MAEQQTSGWGWLNDVGGFIGGVVKDGMAGYIEVEKVKAANPVAQAADQNATFDSPEVDENPTAKAKQTVAKTANGTGPAGLLENHAALYVAGGLALVGAVLLLKRR